MALGIAPFHPRDGGEALTLQRAAFVTEAQLYGSPWLPAPTIADRNWHRWAGE